MKPLPCLVLLFCMLFLQSTDAQSQKDFERHNFRVGTNFNYIHQLNDIQGIGYYLEYGYAFGRRFMLVGRVAYSQGDFSLDSLSYGLNSFTLFSGNSVLRITPLPRLFGRFKFDVGSIYNITRHEFDIRLLNNSNFQLEGKRFFHNLGLFGSVSLNIIHKKYFELGLRVDSHTNLLTQDFNSTLQQLVNPNDLSIQIGPYLGIKF
jgi:hypothetical protein